MPSDASLLGLFSQQVRTNPQKSAYQLWNGIEAFDAQGNSKPQNAWTYGALSQHVETIASALHSSFGSSELLGQRILLAYAEGLEIIAALLACWRVGAIAVPVKPVQRHQGYERYRFIVQDAQATCVLTTQHLLEKVRESVGHDDAAIPCLATDTLAHGDKNASSPSVTNWEMPCPIALLQYTSGSTGLPKGVVLRHDNLLRNLELIHQSFGHSSESRGVIWLPPHHDMGLIGGLLQPLYGGFPVLLMSPETFLRRPRTWLEAISAFRATTSGGPDFAYQYCLERIPPEKRDFDLSTWELAFTGAEPVRSQTLDHFAAGFADCGFKKEAFYPCYGLAEATLIVAGGERNALPRQQIFQRQALKQGSAITISETEADNKVSLVGCGTFVERGLIVDPEKREECPTGTVGEIWVKGDCVADGYWQKTEKANSVFAAYLADGRGPFLRTGDLGFLQDDELFITGRLKDLIIIRGQNWFPQDIEQTVQGAHHQLMANRAAAFGVEIHGQERLVVFQELKREALRAGEHESIVAAIKPAISKWHGVPVAAIWLLKPGQLPITTSGKVRRSACRELFQERALTPVHQWAHEFVPVVSGEHRKSESLQPVDRDDVEKVQGLIHWLRDYAATALNSRLMDERRSIPPSVVLDFGNQGLLGMQVPTTSGGLGLSHQGMLQILEQLGGVDPTLGLFVGLNNVLGIQPILSYGQPGLQADYLERLANGRELAAFALTEPGSGSHPFSLRSEARPTVAGWRLSGEKIWSGSAAWAGITNVFVQEYDSAGNPLGISAFAVPRGTVGLRQGPESLTMGMRAMVQNTIYLENAKVSDAYRLGAPGQGIAIAKDALMYGRLAIAGACIGGMKRCAQLMLRYSAQRRVSTGVLLDNPVTLTRLGRLTHAIASVECLVQLIVQRLDQGLAIPEELFAACKVLAPEFYWQAADDLVQLLGGRGYIEPNFAPQILRDSRILRIFEGPTETLAMYLGSRVLFQPNELQGFFSGLGLESLGQTLFDASQRILNQYQSPRAPFQSGVEGQRHASYVVGNITAWVLLLAAIEKATLLKSDGTATWVSENVQQLITNALKGEPHLGMASSATEITQEIERYQLSIGDVEQTLPGEEKATDIYLRSQTQQTRQTQVPVQSQGGQVESQPAIVSKPSGSTR
ncbi:MAG: AMP-binding protein, partial [Cyanobacteria bacterium P01_H01_bin.15]